MKIAIIGSGISGLVAARELAIDHEVCVFEANNYIGGHTHTHLVNDGHQKHTIDTGFIVCNDRTYPHFFSLLDELQVKRIPTTMGFSVSEKNKKFAYAGTSLNAVFAERSQLFNIKFWGMLKDIIKFNREAESDLEYGLSMEEYLLKKGYSNYFIERYVIPMGAAIWSSDPAQIRQMPMRFFIQFFHNHGLLTVMDQPQWYVIDGGSSAYIKPLTAHYADKIRLNSPVLNVTRHTDHVLISSKTSHKERFDAVVFACHSDQALRLLDAPSAREEVILKSIPYQVNKAVLHTDTSVLPHNKRAWAAWNYQLSENCNNGATLSYNMNILQHISSDHVYSVTLNQLDAIDEKTIIKEIDYYHPVFSESAVNAQDRWQEISGHRNTYYCGAYWRWGFHEDGVFSGLRAANQIMSDFQNGSMSLQRLG